MKKVFEFVLSVLLLFIITILILGVITYLMYIPLVNLIGLELTFRQILGITILFLYYQGVHSNVKLD